MLYQFVVFSQSNGWYRFNDTNCSHVTVDSVRSLGRNAPAVSAFLHAVEKVEVIVSSPPPPPPLLFLSALKRCISTSKQKKKTPLALKRCISTSSRKKINNTFVDCSLTWILFSTWDPRPQATLILWNDFFQFFWIFLNFFVVLTTVVSFFDG